MDGATATHVIYWIIGGMSLVATIGFVGASIAMGRSAYRED